jgi:hypothetical protein
MSSIDISYLPAHFIELITEYANQENSVLNMIKNNDLWIFDVEGREVLVNSLYSLYIDAFSEKETVNQSFIKLIESQL